MNKDKLSKTSAIKTFAPLIDSFYNATNMELHTKKCKIRGVIG